MSSTTFSGPVTSTAGFIGAGITNTSTSVQGTSASPVAITAADTKLNSGYATTSATSGDTRLRYEKLTFTGAGGSGETARFYSVVTVAGAAVGGTINGAHISMDVDGSGTISGAGNALRVTLGGTSTNPGGTLSSLQLDSNFATGGTWTNASYLRFTNSGTGSITYLMNVPTIASGGIFAAHTTEVMTNSIRIIDAAGAVRYIMCTTAATNRTGGA